MQPVVMIERSGECLSPDALSPAERARWEGLRRQQDRDDFVGARVLAARAVRALGETEVRFEQRCERCGGPHGRPYVVGSPVAVSWAHTGGWVAAVAAEDGPVGIDVEAVGPDDEVALGRTGRSFVRAEALVKAGVFGLDDALRAPLDWPFGDQRAYAGFDVVDLAHGPLIGAVATPAASGSG